jgi:hypothetical protein
MAGGAPESDPQPAGLETTVVAVACGAATIFFGIIPTPLFDLAADAGRALGVL